MANGNLLRSILQAIPFTVYTLDTATRELTFLNREIFLGYALNELQTQDSLLRAVHPDDLAAVRAHWQNVLQLAEGETGEIKYRLRSKAGAWRWVHSWETVIVNQDDGPPNQLLITLQDISEYKQSEQALAESEARFRRLYEQAPLGYQSLDENGRFLEVNQAWLDMTGYTRDEVIGRWIGEFLATTDVEMFTTRFARFLETGRVVGHEFVMVCKDGSPIIVSFDGRIGYDADGRFLQTHCIVNDITERRRAEDQRRLQTQALEAAANSIIITDRDGIIQWVNPAFTRLTGYTAEEVVGENPRFLKSNRHNRAFYQTLWETILSGQIWRGQMINRRKDGTFYHDEMTITPVRNEQGAITHFIAIKQDVTGRVEAEARLHKWAQIFEHADWGIVTGSAENPSIIEMMNPAFARMHGRSMEELIGKPLVDIFAPEVHTELPNHIRAAHERGHHSYQSWNIRKDGSIFPVLVNVTAVKDPENGRVLYRVANVQDITDRVRAETEIRQKSQQLAFINSLNHAANRGDSLAQLIDLVAHQVKDIFASNEASVYLVSEDKQYLVLQTPILSGKLRQGIEKIIGRPIPEAKIRLVEGGVYWNILQSGQAAIVNDPAIVRQMMAEHTEDRRLKKVVPQIARLLGNQSIMHIPLISAGQPIGLLDVSRKTPFDKTNLVRLAEVAEQLTAVIKRKQAEESLKRVSRRNRLILQAASEGIFGLDLAGKTIFANAAAEHMLGWRAAELIGKSHHDIIHHSHADGSPYPAADCPVYVTIRDGTPHRCATDLFWRKDGSGFPVEFASSPIYEGDKQVGAVVTFIDISERLRQENYLQGQQRLATVGQLAAGIAHDFNNIMAVISLYTDLTTRALDPLHASQKHLQTIRTQAYRAADLIRQILDFSRQTVMERRPVELLPFLKELLKLLGRTLPENIHLQLDYDGDRFPVSADLTQLQQLLMNLAVNARDAMPDGGTLRLRLTHLHLAKSDPPPLPDIPPGDWVNLDVTDTGSGIAPENINRIFEPFFTTKPVGKGTGLGLAQVFGIVKQHDGYIGVASQEGVGTTFSIYLPIADSNGTADQTEPAVQLPQGNGELILVVEDEAAIRTAVCDILTSLNYRSLAAADGEEALRLYAQHAGAIALVVSDMMMPGMNGLDLHARLHAIQPHQKFLLLSGYPLEDDVWQQEGIVDWIKKPVSMVELAQILHRALNEPGNG